MTLLISIQEVETTPAYPEICFAIDDFDSTFGAVVANELSNHIFFCKLCDRLFGLITRKIVYYTWNFVTSVINYCCLFLNAYRAVVFNH